MSYRMLAVGLVAFFAWGGLAAPADAAVVFVSTGHTGAQVQCDVDHTQHWTYSVSEDVVDVVGGLFEMKVGPHTDKNITFTIFEGVFADYGKTTPLLSVTLAPSAFAQSFGNVLFQSTPITLARGATYTGVLSSAAPDNQAEAYFIKGGSASPLFFVDNLGEPVSLGGAIVAPMPEPTTLSLLILGGAATMIRRHSRR